MVNFWRYEDEDEYRERQKREFESSVVTSVTEKVPEAPFDQYVQEEKGILGKIGGVVGGAMKPLDFLQTNISEPLAAGIASTVRDPSLLTRPQDIPLGEFGKGVAPWMEPSEEFTTQVGEEWEKLPLPVQLGASVALDPLTYVPLGIIPKVLKGAKAAKAARTAFAGLPEADAAKKLVKMLEITKPVRQEIDELRHATKQKQAAITGKMMEKAPGLKTQFKSLGVLKGEAPDIKAVWGDTGLDWKDWDELVKRVHMSDEQVFTKIHTSNVLVDLMEKGTLPSFKEIADLEKIFGAPQLGSVLRKAKGWPSKLWQEFWELANVPRAIMASWDMSAPLRQGVLLAPGHFKDWAKSIRPMIRAFMDEDFAKTYYKALTEGADAARREKAGLFMAEFGDIASAASREEVYIGGRLASAVPLVSRSERAYVTFLNSLRANVFDSVTRGWDDIAKTGGKAIAQGKADEVALAHFLNAASGRGSLPGALKKYPELLSATFFSPRLLIGRVEAGAMGAKAIGQVAIGKGSPVTKMIAKDVAAFVGTGVGILSLLKMSGAADVEIDPRSSDFGKVRVGQMRFDFWGGYQPIARYTAQLIAGERKSIGTGEEMPVDRQNVALNFLRSKLSPLAGATTDIMAGETMMGEQMGTSEETRTQVWNRLAPLFIQDLAEAVQSQGPMGALKAAPGAVGVGVQTFETSGQKVERIAKEQTGQEWKELGSVERQRLEAEFPEVAKARQEQLEASAKWGYEAPLKVRQLDSDFESKFMEASKGGEHSSQELMKLYQDFLNDRSARAEVFYAEMEERPPRSELESQLDKVDALAFDPYASEADRIASRKERKALLDANPDLAEAVVDRRVLRFKSEEMKSLITEMETAKADMSIYYEMPTKLGMSVEDQERVQPIVAEATSRGELMGRPAKWVLMTQMPEVSETDKFLVLQYMQLPSNPERKKFKLEHPESFSFYRSGIDYEAASVGGEQ